MKKFKLLGLLLVIPFLAGCNGSVSLGNYENADKYLIGNQVYQGNITTINVDWISGEVKLIADENASDIKIVEENTLKDEDKVHTWFTDGTLNVKFFAANHRAQIDPRDKHVAITYNPSYLERASLSLTSGRLITPTLNVKEEVLVELTSGNAEIEGIITKRVNLYQTSGSMTINKLEADKLMINSTSGHIDIKNVDINELNAKLTSGNLALSLNRLNSGIINLTSGSVSVKLPSDGGKVTIDKTSGTINASREHTQSGNLYTFGEGSMTLSISLTSGSVTLF